MGPNVSLFERYSAGTMGQKNFGTELSITTMSSTPIGFYPQVQMKLHAPPAKSNFLAVEDLGKMA